MFSNATRYMHSIPGTKTKTNDASLQVSMSLLVGYFTWHRTPI
jgi:hypothetical protein